MHLLFLKGRTGYHVEQRALKTLAKRRVEIQLARVETKAGTAELEGILMKESDERKLNRIRPATTYHGPLNKVMRQLGKKRTEHVRKAPDAAQVVVSVNATAAESKSKIMEAVMRALFRARAENMPRR